MQACEAEHIWSLRLGDGERNHGHNVMHVVGEVMSDSPTVWGGWWHRDAHVTIYNHQLVTAE